MRHTAIHIFLAAWLGLGGLTGLAGCGSGGGGGDTTVTGTGTLPNGAPAANTAVVLRDLSSGQPETLATGVTDPFGKYTFVGVKQSQVQFVVVSSTPQVSGLLEAKTGFVQKDVNVATDIACRAGVTAVTTGALAVRLLDAQRIANLEAAAVREVPRTDFRNPDSIAAAVARVRAVTNDGAVPPP